MDSTYENNQSQKFQELTSQISALEERFVELFVKDGNRDLLRRIHVQLMVLKTELQLKNSRCL